MYHTDLLPTKYVNNSSIIVLAISLFILYNPASLFDTIKQMLEKRSRFVGQTSKRNFNNENHFDRHSLIVFEQTINGRIFYA